MEKVKTFIKKMLNSKNKKNLIISIVALVQCVILVGVMSYSWIESVSSLKIKGENLPISDNINYLFDVKSDPDIIDLSTYFRPTALYQMANASSYDARNFFFKKDDNTYRRGDTTDYNTSYYNFDLVVRNETEKSYAYYFNTANIFDITSDNPNVTEDLLGKAEGAMRIAVSTGSNSNYRIYSFNEKNYDAVSAVNAGTTNITTTALSGSKYVYDPNSDTNDPNTFVFQSISHGEDISLNIKIWFEERDTEYQALTDEQKQALMGATVKIDFYFINAASDFHTFYFDDYTFSIENGYLGQRVTTEGSSKKLYFYYKNNNEGHVEEAVIPMTISSLTNNPLRWVTASEEGDPAPRISKDMINQIGSRGVEAYFFYGTFNIDDKNSVNVDALYKWNVSTPKAKDSAYVFNALSVNKTGTNVFSGYGEWSNVEIELWEFKDETCTATTEDYNKGGYRFVDNKGQGHLYITSGSSVTDDATRMFYDLKTGTWKGYFKKNGTPYFNYIDSDVYSSNNVKVRWQASNPPTLTADDKKIYTALGYTGTDVVSKQSLNDNTNNGVGTWGQVELLKLSNELIESFVNKDKRYKVSVTVNGNTCEYYMTKNRDNLTWGVYIPKGAGENDANDTKDVIQFKCFDSVSSTESSGIWNSSNAKRNGSSTYYATNLAGNSSEGQWYIAVFVDGTADNIVNDVLSNVNVTNARLQYSINDGTQYLDMTKLDDTRWYVKDLKQKVNIIKYRWTAYKNNDDIENGDITNDVIDTIFDYDHDLSSGIYFTITE